MKAKTLVASVLIALGILAFVYQGIIYSSRETAFELGSLQVSTQRTRTIPISPIVGAVALISGLVLLFVGASKPTVPVIAGKE
jgi:hypothetical protein